VSFRWLPRPPRWSGWGFRKRRERADERDRDGGWLDAVPDAGCDLGDELAVGLILLVLTLLAWFVVFPLVALLFDVLFVLLIASAGIALRVVARRPWVVEVEHRSEQHEWLVVGWRAGRRTIEHITRELERGMPIKQVTVPWAQRRQTPT
jgi:hypothetical protein